MDNLNQIVLAVAECCRWYLTEKIDAYEIPFTVTLMIQVDWLK